MTTLEITRSARPEQSPHPNAASTREELVAWLVSRIAAPQRPESAPGTERKGSDEILLDMELEDARYLLVRMPRAQSPRVRLSPREQEIVRMVAQGHSNKIIADVLTISSWTVCTHLRRIFAKLGVGSRAAMVARLMEISSEHPRKVVEKPCVPGLNGHRRAS